MTEKYYKVSHTDIKDLMSYAIFVMAAEETLESAADGIKKWSEDADTIISESFEEITND